MKVATAAVAVVAVLASCNRGGSSEVDVKSIDDIVGKDQNSKQLAIDNRSRAFEEKIAGCMRKSGFEYNVYKPNSLLKVPPTPPSGKEESFYRKQGFGYLVSRAFVSQSPNDIRAAKMSGEQRRAYEEALYGKSLGSPRVAGLPTGCFGMADRSIRKHEEPFTDLRKELDQRVRADPEVLKLDRKFISCMQKSGYPIQTEEELYSNVLDIKLLEISQKSLTTELRSDPQKKNEILAKLNGIELTVAGAYSDCRPQEDWDRLRVLRKKHEEPFLEEHRADLERISKVATWK